jgi:hypothetical protein
VAQEGRPGVLAGVLDGLLGGEGAARDGALERGGVLGVERRDLLLARAVGLGEVDDVLGHGGSLRVVGAGAGLVLFTPALGR